jgi:hypothetical protein
VTYKADTDFEKNGRCCYYAMVIPKKLREIGMRAEIFEGHTKRVMEDMFLKLAKQKFSDLKNFQKKSEDFKSTILVRKFRKII